MMKQRLRSAGGKELLIGILLGTVVLLALLAPSSVSPARADVPGSGDPPLADDVYANLLSEYEITTTAPPPGTLSGITASQASATAAEEYDHLGGTIASTHLVLLSDPVLGDAPTEEAAGEDDAVFTPVYMSYLAWLVVIRGASEVVSFPGRSAVTYSETLAVFIDANNGKELESVTLPPL